MSEHGEPRRGIDGGPMGSCRATCSQHSGVAAHLLLLLLLPLSVVRAGAAASPRLGALLSPSYISPGSSFGDLLAVLAATGLANRESPNLWLNSSATAWVNGVPVMWSYPEADSTWLAYLKQAKNIEFETAADAKLCTLFGHPAVSAAVKGLVRHCMCLVIPLPVHCFSLPVH